MYEAFYGLREKPFSMLPDPAFLYLGEQHSTALAMLQYGLMDQAGFTVITGGIGCGKTMLIRHLLDHIEDDTTVGLITNTHQSFGELLQWVLLAFGLEYRDKSKAERYEILVDFLIGEYAQDRRTILIIDEAQNLAPSTLEEFRMLSNLNADKDQVLQLMLVGQPELHAALQRPDLSQFAQRIAVNYHLEPLDVKDTREYIRHRISVAGGNPSLFRPEAYEVVHGYSQGVPRLINVLCDTALVYGYSAQRKRIDARLVHEVGRDKVKGGLFEQGTSYNSKSDESPVGGRKEWWEAESPAAMNVEIARELFSELRKKARN